MVGEGYNWLSDKERYERAIREYAITEEDAQVIPGKPAEFHLRESHDWGKDKRGLYNIGFEDVSGPFSYRGEIRLVYKKDPKIAVRRWGGKCYIEYLDQKVTKRDFYIGGDAYEEYKAYKTLERVGETEDGLLFERWEVYPEIVEKAIQEIINGRRMSSVTQLLIDMAKEEQEMEREEYHSYSTWRWSPPEEWQLGPREYDERELCDAILKLLQSKNNK